MCGPVCRSSGRWCGTALVVSSLLTGFLCEQVDALVITEIHYHPAGSGALSRRFEFVEVYNDAPDPIDLSGYYFSDGVSFTFPPGTLLVGHQYLVVAADIDLLTARHAGVNAIGNWSAATALDNGGERVSISNRSGALVTTVDYNDRGSWPAGADGTGHSLALLDVYRDIKDPDNWAMSDQMNGTPGKAYSRVHFNVNEVDFDEIPSLPPGASMDENGFIVEWLVLGPYQGAECSPGSALSQDWLTEGPGGVAQTDLEWMANQIVDTDFSSAASTGLHSSSGNALPTLREYRSAQDTIDFDDEVYGSSISTMAYAMTYVINDSGGPLATDVALASDDGIEVLVQGTVVHSNSICRVSGTPGTIQDRSPVTLAVGRSLVMVKIFHSGGDWQFRLRFEQAGTQTPLGPASGLSATFSAGNIGPVRSLSGLRINEALIDTAGPRWVEFHNASSIDADLSGLYLTDNSDTLERALLPANTVVPAGAWLTFEDTALGLDFSLDLEAGRDRVFVALYDAAANRVVDAYTFRPVTPERSEARVPDSGDFVAEAAEPTRGAANQVTVSEWIVINEIHYHPMLGDPEREFVELHHRGDAGDPSVDLSGWQLTQGVNYVFPGGTTMLPGEYLVVAHDPALLQSIYDLSGVQVVGPDNDAVSLAAFGVLRNSGERVTLVDEFGNMVDSFRYHDGGHWSAWPDGGGSSLELIDPWSENDSPQAWDASDDSAKAEVQEFLYTGQQANGESELQLALLGRGMTIVDDIHLGSDGLGATDIIVIDDGDIWRYFKGTVEPPSMWNQLSFDDSTWLEGPTGLGYGDGDDATVLNDMRLNYLSIYCRREFVVDDLAEVLGMVLRIDYDDGYVAYLNGFEIARSGLTGDPPSYLATSAEHEAGSLEVVNLDAHLHRLQSGANVLAFQVHNRDLDSSDLSFRPRFAFRGPGDPAQSNNLLANGDFDANTADWVIQGNHVRSGRTDQDQITGAGSLKLVATGRGDYKANRVETEVPFGLSSGALYDVSFKARWVVGALTLLTRGHNHGLARSHRLLVPDALGTPGAINSVTARLLASPDAGNLGPVIDDVSQDPVLPGGSAPVTVRARIRDLDGVVAPMVRYALDSPNSVFLTAPVTGPDADGYYEAQIAGQPEGTRVLFEVVAEDAFGARGRYPVDRLARTHPLVLDALDTSPTDSRYAIYRHDSSPDRGPGDTYRFIMHEDNENQLDTQQLQSNAYVDGSLVFEDKIYYGAEMRFAGSIWARVPYGSFRIRLPKDNRLQGRVLKINLDFRHGVPRDVRERLGHYLCGQNGGAGRSLFLETRFVHLKVNDRFDGDRDQVRVPDSDFLSAWFPADNQGDLFEVDDRFTLNDSIQRTGHRDARWLSPPYGGDGDNKEDYRYYFSRRNAEDFDDFDNLMASARVLTPSQTSDALFDDLVDDHFDVESFLRVWAVRLNIDDWDSWGANRGKNAFVYRSDVNGLWYLVPWDLELTFGNLDAFSMPNSATSFWGNNFPEIARFLNRPCIKRRYYGILKEMIDGPFSSDHLVPYLDLLAPFGPINAHVGRPGQWVDQRADRIRGWIGSAVYPQRRLQITTRGGSDFIHDELTLSLVGTTPVEVSFLRVLRNGVEIVPAPASNVCDGIFDWSVDDVPLELGENEIVVMGFNGQGEVVDSDSIGVTHFPEDSFVRGDANGDTIIDIVDAMVIPYYVFFLSVFIRCEDALDVDDTGQIDLTDSVVLLMHLFASGPPPALPFPGLGVDPTGDLLLPCL